MNSETLVTVAKTGEIRAIVTHKSYKKCNKQIIQLYLWLLCKIKKLNCKYLFQVIKVVNLFI